MHRFWICLPIILALVAPAYAGKLDSVEQAAKTQAAKTYVAKKETVSPKHGLVGGNSHGKASQVVSKSKKPLGK